MAGQRPPLVVLGLVVAVIFGGLVIGSVGVASMAGPAAGEPTSPSEGPHLWISITVDENGDAQWSIAYRFDIETPEDQSAFEQLADAVRAGEFDQQLLTISTMEDYLADAASVIEREMAITDAGWHDRIDGDIGVLSLEFTWENFATVEDQTIVIGDVFHGQDGLWFESLSADAKLTISAPDGYKLESPPASASVDGNTVTWEGPATFTGTSLSLQFSHDDQPLLPVPLEVILVLAIFIAVFGGLAVGYRREWQLLSTKTGKKSPSSQPSEPDEPAQINEELLSDPERVERMLRANGGRMKQAKIVEETGWSSAKVSQLLSEMADEGRVQKLRIGQENLISLPEGSEEPDSTE